MKSRAQTDRIWTNLRQGRGTVTQQNHVLDILQHPSFSLVNITKLFSEVYPEISDTASITTISKKRTEALRNMLRVLDAIQSSINAQEEGEEP